MSSQNLCAAFEERGKLNLDNCPLGDLAAELNLFTNYIEKTNLEKKMNEKKIKFDN